MKLVKDIGSVILIGKKKSMFSIFIVLLDIFLIQLVFGGVVVLWLSGVLVFGLDFKTWLTKSAQEMSLIIMSVVYVSSFVSIRRFTSYLGNLSFRYVVPVCLFWLTIAWLVLLIFRMQYSVYYITVSGMFMLAFFITTRLLRSRYHQRVVAYIAAGRIADLPDVPSITWKKLTDSTIDKYNVDIVMADLRADLSDEWEHFLAECTLRHIPVFHSSRFIEMVSGRVKIDHLYENELGSLLPAKSYKVIKRLLDFFLIVISSPIILPIMIITGLLVFFESRGGIFFIQERIGQGGIPFRMYKFRSMYTGTVTDITTKDIDDRVTKFGRFIRKTRIDELPQFYNVLRGEMSLIGPRAEFHKFAEEYEREIPFYSYRHIVKPGISGWAQVMQGYNFGVDETKVKLEYDFYYIKNFSFSIDLLIFFKTIQTVLTGFGAR